DVQYFSPGDDPVKVAGMIARYFQNDPVFRFAVRARRDYTWEQIYQEKIEPLLKTASTVTLNKED
ncbi:MAG: hypothetical protein AB1649_31185, partial [Chloroflexota bacterium]